MCNIDKFKSRTKELCNQYGISQKYLCDKIGRAKTYLNDVWNGKTNIKDNDLITIATILHTTPEYLKGETDDSKSEESAIIEINKSHVKRRLLDKIAAMSDDDVQAIENLLNHFIQE